MAAVAFVHPGGAAMLAAPTGRAMPMTDRLIVSRVRVLQVIAERYAELVDPMGGPSGLRGDGDAVGMMPRTYTPSVREFERLVCRLRVDDRALWWHLDGWWLAAEPRTVWLCPRCGVTHKPSHVHPSRRNSGKPVEVKCKRVVIWSRRAGARESTARQGLEWVAGEWRLGSEPMLPDEIRAVA